MKFLITGDWQTDSRNLDLIGKAMTAEVSVGMLSGARGLIDLGDQKQPYNPIDARIEFAMRERWRQWNQGISVKGNHDRLSQNDNLLSWLPLLKRKGVSQFTEPGVHVHDGVTFYVLPYHSDPGTLKAQAKELAKLAAEEYSANDKVLLFHCDVQEADYGTGHTPENAISLSDLKLGSYDYAFGGHVHKPQQIAPNAWYVGSPFAHNWGEANEHKRFIVYTPGKGIKSVETGLPGYWDWDKIALSKPRGWLAPGSSVRLKIKAKDGTEFKLLEAKRKEQFTKRFPGINLHCVAEYEAQQIVDYSFTQGTDAQKVTEYVAQRYDGDKWLTKYLIDTLEKVGGQTTTNTEGLVFYKAHATNYTSFKDLTVDFRNQGLVLVRGDNQDWPGRSNAAGKSNLFDLIIASMFGETRKGQSADKWASDDGAKKASLKLWFKNAQGQKVLIERGRRPAKIAISVNGKDKSSGLTGKEKTGTQGLITQLSGYDQRMLVNAVYINQDQAQAFLAGTRKEKSELLYRYQGLERFDEARKIVGRHYADEQARGAEFDKKLAVGEAQYAERQDQLDGITADLNGAEEKLASAKANVGEAQKGVDHIKKQLRVTPKVNTQTLLLMSEKLQKAKVTLAKVEDSRDAIRTQLIDIGNGICNTCGQILPEGEETERRRKKLDLQHKKWSAQVVVEQERVAEIRTEYEKKAEGLHVLETLESELTEAMADLASVQQAEQNLLSSAVEVKARGDELRKRMDALHGELEELRRQYKKVKARLSILDRAKACLDRTGIPAYICGLLCPVLTKAAQHYATLFADDTIQVVFEFTEGDFDCKVINAQGSSTLEGLSAGENSTAALIVAFALRSAAPKTNVLILDEPGRGLDELGQRQFAEGLDQLKREFETVFITTHERALETNLHADSEWTVVKHNRVSKVVHD